MRKPKPTMLDATSEAILRELPTAPPKPAALKPARAKPATKYPRPPSREGTRGITTWVDPEIFRALKDLAHKEETSMQALMSEGIERVFADRRRKGISGTG